MRKTQTLLSLVMAAGLYGCGEENTDSRDAGKLDAAKTVDSSVTSNKDTSSSISGAGTADAKLAPDTGIKPGVGDAARPGNDNDGGRKQPAGNDGAGPGRDNDDGAKPLAGDGGARPGRDNDGGPKPPADDDGPGHDNDGGARPVHDGGARPGRDNDGGPKAPGAGG